MYKKPLFHSRNEGFCFSNIFLYLEIFLFKIYYYLYDQRLLLYLLRHSPNHQRTGKPSGGNSYTTLVSYVEKTIRIL